MTPQCKKDDEIKSKNINLFESSLFLSVGYFDTAMHIKIIIFYGDLKTPRFPHPKIWGSRPTPIPRVMD